MLIHYFKAVNSIPSRFFILVIVPLILSIILLEPYKQIEIKRLANETSFEKPSLTVFSDEVNFQQKIEKDLFERIFGTPNPFKLDTYNICFEDLGSSIIYGTQLKEIDTDIIWIINFNNTINLTLNRYGENCNPIIKAGNNFTYGWGGEGKIDLMKLQKYKIATLHPNTITYAKPNLQEIIIKTLLIIVGWGSFLWLLTRIYKMIRFGWIS